MWMFLLAGGGMVALLAASSVETALLHKMVGAYTLLLVLTMVGPYLLEKLRYGKVIWHFGFMDQGWRYFARPSGQQHEGVREWDDLLAWYETKAAFHLAYHGQSELQPSPLKKLWSLLNSPLAGLASEARSRHYAMIPKRFLTAQQIGEIRSILTFTTPRGGRSEEE